MAGGPLNVHVTLQKEERIRVEWDFEGERYFFESEASELDPLPRRSDLVEPCLYARPLDFQGEPEKGRMRLISLKKAFARRMVKAVKEIVVSKALVQRAFEVSAEQRKAAEAEQARQVAEAALQHRFGTHGLPLLQALEDIANMSREPEVVAMARAAIARLPT